MVGLLLERLAIRTVRKPHPIVLVIITIGASILLRGLAMLFWGKDAHSAPSFTHHAPIEIAGATLLPQSLWILAVVLIIVTGLQLFYRKTLTGKAMEACAINKTSGVTPGYPQRAHGPSGLCHERRDGEHRRGPHCSDHHEQLRYGDDAGPEGFLRGDAGRTGKFLGGGARGNLLGILEALGVGFFSSSLKDAIAFFLLLLILYARPSGLLGVKAVHRF